MKLARFHKAAETYFGIRNSLQEKESPVLVNDLSYTFRNEVDSPESKAIFRQIKLPKDIFR